MVDHLPEFIDPLALVDKRRQFRGVLPLSKLPRLHDLLADAQGEVRFELRFGKDGKVAAVSGSVEATLPLQCQCCLGAIPWPVKSEVRLGLVKSLAEADLLPESYEALLLEADTIALADIVQDELLLAIPTIPQHESCTPQRALPVPPPPAAAVPQRPNPFAVLAKLKQN